MFTAHFPDEKIQRVFDLSAFVRSACESGIRAEYPAAPEREVFLRITQRTLGDELFKKFTAMHLRDEDSSGSARGIDSLSRRR